MPILLDNPVTYPAVHGKPSETYNEVKAHEVRDRIHVRRLEIQVQYGNTVDGQWKGGKIPIVAYLLRNIDPEEDGQGNVTQVADPQYDNYMATTFPPKGLSLLLQVEDGTLTATQAIAQLDQLYQENATALYQWLQTQEPTYAGTIQ